MTSTPQQKFNMAALQVILYGATVSRLQEMEEVWRELEAELKQPRPQHQVTIEHLQHQIEEKNGLLRWARNLLPNDSEAHACIQKHLKEGS